MYRVGLRLLDGLVVELFVEHLDFTQVVGNALRVESERDERLEATDHVVLCTRRTHMDTHRHYSYCGSRPSSISSNSSSNFL